MEKQMLYQYLKSYANKYYPTCYFDFVFQKVAKMITNIRAAER